MRYSLFLPLSSCHSLGTSLWRVELYFFLQVSLARHHTPFKMCPASSISLQSLQVQSLRFGARACRSCRRFRRFLPLLTIEPSGPLYILISSQEPFCHGRLFFGRKLTGLAGQTKLPIDQNPPVIDYYPTHTSGFPLALHRTMANHSEQIYQELFQLVLDKSSHPSISSCLFSTLSETFAVECFSPRTWPSKAS